MIQRFVFVAAALAAACQAAAASTMFGEPSVSCGSYVYANRQQQALYLDWVSGFLSGENFALNSDVGKSWSSAAMQLWVEQYCNAHPLNNMAQTAIAFREALTANEIGPK